jgi:hypothetical protein
VPYTATQVWVYREQQLAALAATQNDLAYGEVGTQEPAAEAAVVAATPDQAAGPKRGMHPPPHRGSTAQLQMQNQQLQQQVQDLQKLLKEQQQQHGHKRHFQINEEEEEEDSQAAPMDVDAEEHEAGGTGASLPPDLASKLDIKYVKEHNPTLFAASSCASCVHEL